jgi:hypothetical protein
MAKQRRSVLVVVWGVTTVAVTLWIVTRAGEEVTTGNAMLVGVLAATAVTAMLARSKRG